jgi:hypothetical protein
MKIIVDDRPEFTAGWVSARTGYVPGGAFWSAGLMESDGAHQKLVAGVVFDNLHGTNIHGHVAADAPLTKAFIRDCLHAPFIQNHTINSITACARSDNEASLRFLKRLGLEEIGCVRGYYGGADKVIFVQYRETAQKWLNLKS